MRVSDTPSRVFQSPTKKQNKKNTGYGKYEMNKSMSNQTLQQCFNKSFKCFPCQVQADSPLR